MLALPLPPVAGRAQVTRAAAIVLTGAPVAGRVRIARVAALALLVPLARSSALVLVASMPPVRPLRLPVSPLLVPGVQHAALLVGVGRLAHVPLVLLGEAIVRAPGHLAYVAVVARDGRAAPAEVAEHAAGAAALPRELDVLVAGLLLHGARVRLGFRSLEATARTGGRRGLVGRVTVILHVEVARDAAVREFALQLQDVYVVLDDVLLHECAAPAGHGAAAARASSRSRVRILDSKRVRVEALGGRRIRGTGGGDVGDRVERAEVDESGPALRLPRGRVRVRIEKAVDVIRGDKVALVDVYRLFIYLMFLFKNFSFEINF